MPNNIPLSHVHVKAAAKIYADVFLNDEPTSIRHALEPAVFLPYAEEYVRSLVSKNLSFVALDKNSSEIVGFIFCLDFASDIRDEGEEMVQFLDHFKATVALMDDLEEQVLVRADTLPGSVLHVFQIGVVRKNRGYGIAKDLINTVLDHGSKKGFIKVIADCTCPASVRSFTSCGFHITGEIPYETFSIEGKRFFSGLDGGISLLVKTII